MGRIFGGFAVSSYAIRPCGWRQYSCVVLLLVFFNMNSSLAGGDPVVDENRAISAEEAAEIMASPKSAAAGENLYNQVCVYCHGAKGVGGKARKMQCRQYDSQYLYKTISNGKKRGSMVMPSWKRSFSEQVRWELVSYIDTLKSLETCL